MRASEREWQMTVQDSGRTLWKLLGQYDPVTSSWKTLHPSGAGDSTVSPAIWPRSGMTSGGRLYALRKQSTQPTTGIAGSDSQRSPLDETARLFGTPRVSSANGGGDPANPRNHTRLEMQATTVYKTPTANLGRSSAGSAQPPSKRRAGGHGPTLEDEAVFTDALWVSEDGRDYGPAVRRWESVSGRAAPEPAETGPRGGRRLSARFAEWLMGLPDGWVTSLAIGLSRGQQIARIGNGVMPQQAEAAFAGLLEDHRRRVDELAGVCHT